MKQLYKRDLIEIFSTLYKSEEASNNVFFLLDPFEAYIFSTITGAGYVNNESYPFSPRGYMKITNNIINPKLVNGIYDTKFNLTNSSRFLHKKYPFIFDDYKKIVFCEITNFQDYQDFIRTIRDNVKIPENIIVYPIDVSKKGNGLEPILEFMATIKFNKIGYITEHQTPLTQSLGSPDFLAFQFDFPSLLLESESEKKGFHIVESTLFFHRDFNKKLVYSDDFTKSLPRRVVGEAKVVSTNIEERLNKYTKSNFFDSSVKLVTELKDQNKNDSYLSLESGKISLNLLQNFSPSLDKYKLYEEWLMNYLKLYLVSNFTSEVFIDFVKEKNLDETNFFNLKTISMEEIFNII
jgi:hypothetical protein